MEAQTQKWKENVVNTYQADLPTIRKPTAFYCPNTDKPRSPFDPDLSVFHLPSSQSTKISLSCPLSLTRQTTPVRTTACTHVETFDLGNIIGTIPYFDLLIKFSNFRPSGTLGLPKPDRHLAVDAKFRCPTCRRSAALQIDEVMMQ